MNANELASYIDLTLLNPTAAYTDIKNIIEDSLKYPFASLCIPPFYVSLAADTVKYKRRIGTVIGFPLGYQTKKVKIYEAADAVKSGADELDVVMNISAFKSGQYKLVRDEISSIVLANPSATVKVIIETSCLIDAEKIKACAIVIESGAHFVKTSTGFSAGGATIDDIKLLKKAADGKIQINPHTKGFGVGVKASGGIKDLDTVIRMINAGASRIGTSSGIKIIEEFLKRICPKQGI